MADSSLRHADVRHPYQFGVNSVAQLLEAPRGTPENTRAIAADTLNVFDHEVRGLEHLSGSHHHHVQLVLWIVATRVVVQVRVPLTGWTADE